MIVRSILDDDLYKFTMQWAIMCKFPEARVEYTFFNRGKTEFPENFDDALLKEIYQLSNLKLTEKEERFMKDNTPYLPNLYIDFLKGYRYDPKEVRVSQEGGNLSVSIRGFWYRTVLWEVKILAIISELYFKKTGQKPTMSVDQLKDLNDNKMMRMHGSNAFVSDFGTRRRYSFKNHSNVLDAFTGNMFQNVFMGTSNMFLAMKYNVKPIGTHAHEWFMFNGAKYGYKMANRISLDKWSDVYKGDLGIALTDTFTSDAFFSIFDKKMARLFDGVRHDSGDPFEFARKTINHYERLGIDPKSKAIIFSDNLDIDKALEIQAEFSRDIMVRFGIGTHLTNDVGLKPLNIVIKMTKARINHEWVDTVKLSDEQGKETGSMTEVRKAKETLNLLPVVKTLFD